MIATSLKGIRLAIGGLMVLLAIFALFAGATGGRTPPAPGSVDSLRLSAWIVIAAGVATGVVLPGALAALLRRRNNGTHGVRLVVFLATTLLTCTVIEAGAILGVLVTLLSGQLMDVGTTAFGIVALGWHLPTEDRWMRFVEASGGEPWTRDPRGR